MITWCASQWSTAKVCNMLMCLCSSVEGSVLAFVHHWGGKTKVYGDHNNNAARVVLTCILGTNPMSFGFPSEPHPVIWDQVCSHPNRPAMIAALSPMQSDTPDRPSRRLRRRWLVVKFKSHSEMASLLVMVLASIVMANQPMTQNRF